MNPTKITPEIEPIDSYRTHRNSKVYYYNGYEMPLSAKKVSCNSGYDYYKYYSDIMTSTAMLLSTYYNRTIDPIEIYNKVKENKLIKCGEPIDKTKFFFFLDFLYVVKLSNLYLVFCNQLIFSQTNIYAITKNKGAPVLPPIS